MSSIGNGTAKGMSLVDSQEEVSGLRPVEELPDAF